MTIERMWMKQRGKGADDAADEEARTLQRFGMQVG
jgi:hypothetical protein